MKGRSLSQILSVRFDAPLLQAARLFAESKGVSISDVVRAALADYLAENTPAEQWFALPFSYSGYTQGSNVPGFIDGNGVWQFPAVKA